MKNGQSRRSHSGFTITYPGPTPGQSDSAATSMAPPPAVWTRAVALGSRARLMGHWPRKYQTPQHSPSNLLLGQTSLWQREITFEEGSSVLLVGVLCFRPGCPPLLLGVAILSKVGVPRRMPVRQGNIRRPSHTSGLVCAKATDPSSSPRQVNIVRVPR